MSFKSVLSVFALGAFLVGSSPVSLADHKPGHKGSPTADDQSNKTPDREVTRKIRRAIVDDKSLSTAAHNVKIITKDGVVTLRGAVPSDAEKRAVEEKAISMAGGATVKNELQVSAKK